MAITFMDNVDKVEIQNSINTIGEMVGLSAIEPIENDIPKIFFGGALQQNKVEVVVPFRYISKTKDFSCYAKIKAQGNSSLSYPKKNQTVKLYKDAECTEKLTVNFKGWGEQYKFCIKANWIDLTHARNIVSARLWSDAIRTNSNFEEWNELLKTSPNLGAIDGFPVKVYANGKYQGRYTWNIPKDAWMANMDESLDNHCILHGEGYTSGCFRASAVIDGSDWTDEVHDIVPESIKTKWNEIIDFVMTSTDEDFKAQIGNYFDIESLIDYHLFALLSCGFDAYGKNQMYMTYDGQKWIAQMYDMDSTWGLWWTGSSFVSTEYGREDYQDYQDGNGNLLYIRLEELFPNELWNRWVELKHNALSLENIINKFERFTDICPLDLVKEDYASTTNDGLYTGIPSKTTNNIQQLRDYACARYTWTNDYVQALVPEVVIPCTGITLNQTELTFTEGGSQTISATVTPIDTTEAVVWTSDNTSVAVVNNGVVRAIYNGTATITATCGNQSATCTVTVSNMTEVAALYPFENGEKTLSSGNAQIRVSNGNHVYIKGTSTGNWNISEVSQNINLDDRNSSLGYKTTKFSLKANDKVRTVITFNTDTTNFSGQLSVYYVPSGEFTFTNMVSDTYVTSVDQTTVATSNVDVGAIGLWASTEHTMEFDIKIYVNNVRYV